MATIAGLLGDERSTNEIIELLLETNDRGTLWALADIVAQDKPEDEALFWHDNRVVDVLEQLARDEGLPNTAGGFASQLRISNMIDVPTPSLVMLDADELRELRGLIREDQDLTRLLPLRDLDAEESTR